MLERRLLDTALAGEIFSLQRPMRRHGNDVALGLDLDEEAGI
jgi:hypothetical protein